MSAPPEFLPPMECQETAQLPAGREWQYELKLDGYRAVASRTAGGVSLRSRKGLDFRRRFPSLVCDLESLSGQYLVDGEVVALDEHGRPSFSALQNSQGRRKRPDLHFYIFDLLARGKSTLIHEPLSQRRSALENAFPTLPDSIRFAPILHGEPDDIVSKVREFEFEGVVAKRRDSPYEPGERPGTWLKAKLQRTGDFIIGGHTGASNRVDELLVGEQDGEGLRFVASVHAGLVAATRRAVAQHLQASVTDACPFYNLPERGGSSAMTKAKMTRVRWVEPTTTVEIAFQEWTPTRRLRHASFVRLRDDK